MSLGPEGIITRDFENRLSGERFPLPREEFALEFDDGRKISSESATFRPGTETADLVELFFQDPSGVEVRVEHRLPAGAHYVRKQISVRRTTGARRRLVQATLENWEGVKGHWTTPQGDRQRFGSHPISSDALWAGVEFVAAFNQCGPDGFKLGSRPGRRVIGEEWTPLHSTVIGVARAGGARDAFLRYIDDIRLSPPRMQACYNSWWTLPKVVKQSDNLALIRELREAMFGRHGVFFDIVTTDMGWSNPRSIWEIDRTILPQGFDDIRAIVEPAGGKLGLWMSPSEIYPPVCDYDWAASAGYTVLRPENDKLAGYAPACNVPGLSLADPRYRVETCRQLQRLIRENGLAHIKYDGFWAIEREAHHGIAAGDDSVEPLAEYSLQLLRASKQANPQLVTEPTYMNSIVNYISPWIIKYSDTVWANGEDCVVGIGPAPDYRESHTNAREYMIFQARDQVWLPQNAVHYFDIVHVDAADGFPNHAAMAFGRGRFFLSTYLNPKLMNDEDWRIYAGLLQWARQNADILRNTKVIPSRVERGEPYAYAHWLGRRSIIAIRNPSNQDARFLLDLTTIGAPSDLTDGVCWAQFPHRRGIAEGLGAASKVPIEMAPWEVVFLEILPRSELREPVALGARWYRGADGQMSFVPEPGAENVRVLGPAGMERVFSVTARKGGRPAVAGHSIKSHPAPEAEWLAIKPKTIPLFPFRYPADFNTATLDRLRETEWKTDNWKKMPTTGFEAECSVSFPPQASARRVLLLVEFPGRVFCPSRCTATIDGRTTQLETRESTEHIGYYNWTGNLKPFESEWCWYIADVGPGSHRIRFEGAAGHSRPRIGLWAWSDDDLTDDMQPAHVPCTEPAMPQYRGQMERHGSCIGPPTETAP